MINRTAKQARMDLISRMKALMRSQEYLEDGPKAQEEIKGIDETLAMMDVDDLTPSQRLHMELEGEIEKEGASE